MTYVMVLVCAAAALLQWMVLHDPRIVEPEAICNLRRMRIAAHLIAAAYGVYLIATDYWLQVPLAISVSVLGLVDALTALWRGRPQIYERTMQARQQRRARAR